MGFWDKDFEAGAWYDIPVRLRQAVQYAWAKVCISPVVYLAGLFRTYRNNNLYDLSHNGQVCKLEAVLNDTFDPIDRRIFIADPDYVDPEYTYLRSELKPLYLWQRSEVGVDPDAAVVYTYRRSEVYTGGGVQFIVHMPVGLVYDSARLTALIDKYRLPSKVNYTVVSP